MLRGGGVDSRRATCSFSLVRIRLSSLCRFWRRSDSGEGGQGAHGDGSYLHRLELLWWFPDESIRRVCEVVRRVGPILAIGTDVSPLIWSHEGPRGNDLNWSSSIHESPQTFFFALFEHLLHVDDAQRVHHIFGPAAQRRRRCLPTNFDELLALIIAQI